MTKDSIDEKALAKAKQAAATLHGVSIQDAHNIAEEAVKTYLVALPQPSADRLAALEAVREAEDCFQEETLGEVRKYFPIIIAALEEK